MLGNGRRRLKVQAATKRAAEETRGSQKGSISER